MFNWLLLLLSVEIAYLFLIVKRKKLISHTKKNISFFSLTNIIAALITWMDKHILVLILAGIMFLINHSFILYILNNNEQLHNQN